MSHTQLHDLLSELEKERDELGFVETEKNHRLDSLIEALEQQKLYPEEFDQYSTLQVQVEALIDDFEEQNPTFAAVLSSISQVLHNFRS